MACKHMHGGRRSTSTALPHPYPGTVISALSSHPVLLSFNMVYFAIFCGVCPWVWGALVVLCLGLLVALGCSSLA